MRKSKVIKLFVRLSLYMISLYLVFKFRISLVGIMDLPFLKKSPLTFDFAIYCLVLDIIIEIFSPLLSFRSELLIKKTNIGTGENQTFLEKDGYSRIELNLKLKRKYKFIHKIIWFLFSRCNCHLSLSWSRNWLSIESENRSLNCDDGENIFLHQSSQRDSVFIKITKFFNPEEPLLHIREIFLFAPNELNMKPKGFITSKLEYYCSSKISNWKKTKNYVLMKMCFLFIKFESRDHKIVIKSEEGNFNVQPQVHSISYKK
ncbi:MAG: hypothetical protein ACOC4G_07915 [Bacillota bacterium]